MFRCRKACPVRAIARTALAEEQRAYRNDIPLLNMYSMNVAAARSKFLAFSELKERCGINAFAEEEVEWHIGSLISTFVVPETVQVHE